MKIFIGGMKPHHQHNFRRDYKWRVDFTFAAFTEGLERWLGEVNRADHAIIDQSRTTHTTIALLKKYSKTPLYFVDTKPQMRGIIEELLQHGTVHHSYVHPAGSEGVAQRSGSHARE